MSNPSPIEFHLPTVTSTNDYARELLVTYPYVFVSAMHQTSGRGRNGKHWEGDYGLNAYCTLGLRHGSPVVVEDLAAYMARGSLAVVEALRSVAMNVKFRIKYPNDVQALTQDGWKKISGVLIEHEFQADRCISTLVGMGVNVQQELFSDTILPLGTSLHLLGVRSNVLTVVERVKTNITDLRMMQWQEVFKEWIQELNLENKLVSIAGDAGTWRVERILADGRLVVRNDQFNTQRIITDADSVRYND